MKILLFLLCFPSSSAFSEAKQEEKASIAPSQGLKDESPSDLLKKPSKSSPDSIKPTKPEKLSTIQKKIKDVFEDFLEILETEPLESEEYAKAVKFLENSLYNEANFDTLKLLSKVYGEKNDLQNQINVLKILSANHPNNPESFYLLALSYHSLYLNEKESKKEKKCKKKAKEKWKKLCRHLPFKKEMFKKQAIESLNKALKKNPKYTLAYEALMNQLMIKDPKTDEDIHTKESLSVVRDMMKILKKKEYYIHLCKAYYDNNFLKQSRRACVRAVKNNPKDPLSHYILALIHPKDTDKWLLKIAKKFKESFFIQYKTALHFMKKDSKIAATLFDSALSIQPDNIKLNQLMAHFFFDNKQEEKSYNRFLKACQLSEGRFLKEFRLAGRTLRSRQKPDLVLKFQKGIRQCYEEAKQKKEEKKATSS